MREKDLTPLESVLLYVRNLISDHTILANSRGIWEYREYIIKKINLSIDELRKGKNVLTKDDPKVGIGTILVKGKKEYIIVNDYSEWGGLMRRFGVIRIRRGFFNSIRLKFVKYIHEDKFEKYKIIKY